MFCNHTCAHRQTLTLCSCFNADMRQRCAKTLCIVQQSPECPGDSELEEGYAPAGECCPLPSRCVCNPERCPEQLCRPNFDRVLVKRGTNRPGSCCDVYECRAQGFCVVDFFLCCSSLRFSNTSCSLRISTGCDIPQKLSLFVQSMFDQSCPRMF